MKAALRVQHGEETIKDELSGYYLAGNIARTYDGMMIALPDEEWGLFQNMSLAQFVDVFLQLTEKINLLKFKKSRRGIKKPPVKRNKYPNQPHVSTAKLLRGEKPNG